MTTTTRTTDEAPAEDDPTPGSYRSAEPAGRGSGWGRGLYGVRTRVLAWFMVMLTIATLASVLLERQILQARLSERVDEQLNQEAEELQVLIGGRAADGSCISEQLSDGQCDIGRDPETGEPFGNDIASIFDTFLRRNTPGQHEGIYTYVDGRFYGASEAGTLRRLNLGPALLQQEGLAAVTIGDRQPVREQIDLNGNAIRYLAVPVNSADGQTLGTFAVAHLLGPHRAELNESMSVALAAGLATLLVASLGAFLATGRLLAPVRGVIDTARSISDTDLSQRIKVRDSGDEISALARTFNEMLDRLQSSFEIQRTFIDDAGHELRTPITIIRGHLELLGDDPDERCETVGIVTDELDRMNRMVDDLLVLAKAGRPDFLTVQELEVGALTDDLLTKASALAPRDWRLEHRGEGLVVADRQRLTQAVIQLAQNATQHTEEGDRISLGSAVWDNQVRLWIRDTGPGVAPEDADRIFGRFARAACGRRRSEGAGLGLSIVRAIAEAHGGRVELRSRLGAGATFTVVIPATEHPTEGSDAAVVRA